MFRQIDARFFVAPQIDVADVAAAKAAGIVLIVNNRPDGEDASAPQGEQIAAAAAKRGIDYIAIPIGNAGFSHAQIEALSVALASVAPDGPVLAYCRSGTRSTHLWALAQARDGGDPATLIGQAAAAGYDLCGIRAMLDVLAAGSD